MQPFLHGDDFLRSFVARALLEGDLAISDAFFFMSKALAEEVLPRPERENDLVRTAIREGVARPAFRNGVRTYPDALLVIRKQGILGERPDADDLATELHELAPNPQFVPWPETMVGGSFRDEVSAIFREKSPPIDDAYAKDLWKTVTPFRIDAVEEAIKEDKKHGTLRRGELLHQVGLQIGWPKSGAKVRDAAELILFAEKVGKQREVRPYVAWVNQIYERNQATSFNLDASIWSGQGVEQLALYAILPPGSAKATFITKAVRIPAVAELTRDPAAWFEIRRGREGLAYFNALAEWRKHENDDATAPAVLERLAEYAAAVEDAYPNGPREYVEFAVCLDRVPANRGLLNALITNDTLACIIGKDTMATCDITSERSHRPRERTVRSERATLTAHTNDVTFPR